MQGVLLIIRLYFNSQPCSFYNSNCSALTVIWATCYSQCQVQVVGDELANRGARTRYNEKILRAELERERWCDELAKCSHSLQGALTSRS